MTKLLSLLCTTVFALGAAAGCGEAETEKLSAKDQSVADNISSYIVKQSQDTWKKGEADCMAGKFVTIGFLQQVNNMAFFAGVIIGFVGYLLVISLNRRSAAAH